MSNDIVPNFAGKWSDLKVKLDDFTKRGIENSGFTHMTPVQASAIPLFLGHKDVVVEAVTGSGKTLAFLIPLLEKLISLPVTTKSSVFGLIVTPTRELALQIYNVYKELVLMSGLDLDSEQLEPNKLELKNKLSVMLVTGGKQGVDEDLTLFKINQPKLLIGTPGRLNELMFKNKMKDQFKLLEMLVLDEADRLLEMGFSTQLNEIISILPKQRRTGLFSATMTDDLSELVRAGLRNPVKVEVKVSTKLIQQRIPDSLKIGYILCKPSLKLNQIIRFITSDKEDLKYMIYFSTCACVDYFFKVIKLIPELKDYELISLHGQMDVKRRTATYQKYVSLPSTQKSILLTTDVASRGLDIPSIDCVIHYDLPTDPKAFAHRCGRCARANRKGKALFFLSQGQEELYPDFLKVRKVPTLKLKYLKSINGNGNEMEDLEVDQFLSDLRDKVILDRDIIEKGIKAYVSNIRAYSKHLASFIFRIQDLDLADVAKAFLLLRLPKMPELKDKKLEFNDHIVKLDDIPYLDKVREQQRLNKLSKTDKSQQIKRKSKQSQDSAWSKQSQSKLNKKKKKESLQQKAILHYQKIKDQQLKKELE